VSDAERESISAATGVGGREIDEMTLAGHYGSPLITIDRRTGRADAVGSVVSGSGSARCA
jgi:hypothetical protein